MRDSMSFRPVFLSVLMTLAACNGPGTEPVVDGEVDPDSTYVVAFDSVWARYDRTYPYFDFKQIDWNAARDTYRPRAAAATTSEALALVVHDMLGPLRDVHSSLIRPSGVPWPTYVPTKPVNWTQASWQTTMSRGSIINKPGNWGHGRIDGVPYIYFASWGSGLNVAAVDTALELYRDSPSMILDVRMNGGGNDALAFQVAGRFHDATHTIGTVQYRSGPQHSEFGGPIARTVARRGPWTYAGNVIVLAGRGTFSSAENFVMAMRVLPNVTVAGDTTGGGSGNPTTYDLLGGWKYYVPRWIERLPDGQVVEWNGIAPAVVVATTGGSAGADAVLEWAIGAAQAATASARRELQLPVAVRADHHAIPVLEFPFEYRHR